MKNIIYILLVMLLSGWILSKDTDRDTVLKGIRIAEESSLNFLENGRGLEAENTQEEEDFSETQDFSEEDFGETDFSDENLDAVEEKNTQEEMLTVFEEEKTAEFEDAHRQPGNEESFTDDVKAEMMRKQQDLYAYSTLEITQQNLYVEILYALENYIEEMTVSTKDTSEIDKVFQCVLMDHPELFYTDGYSFVKYTLGEEIKKITFKGTYIYTWEEKNERQEKIEQAALNLLKQLPSDATDYEKVKYVYETIIHQTEYSVSAPDNQNICSVFLGQVSVCQGYAKAVQYLLQKLGVNTTLVLGTVETGEGHAWNMVKVNNQYYYVDATWGDASYLVQMKEGLEQNSTPSISYDYLCVTTEDILQTHHMSDMIPLPICDSLDANYYVREGAYFREMNYGQLEQLIERYRQESRESVTLKCADTSVYQQMVRELIEEQNIFQYLPGEDNSIVYTESEKQRSLTFWM